jgi:hypothetical protein
MSHPLAGPFSVAASVARIRRYRYVEERMMRILGGWIALTPELSVKLLFGRHVWDCAQHADLWGKRLPELRAPAHESEAPGEAFARVLDDVDGREHPKETPERLVGIYRVVKPHLLATYEQHLREANPVYEPPTRRILARCVAEERRHVASGEAILRHHLSAPELAARAADWERRLRADLARAGGLTGAGVDADEGARPSPEGIDIGDDLLRLVKPLERWPMPAELEAAVEVLGRAIEVGDAAGIAPLCAAGRGRGSTAPEEPAAAAGPALDQLARAAGSRVTIAGCARIGRQWVVKLHAEGEAGGGVVALTRWLPDAGAWRIAEVELARLESHAARA